MITSLFYRSDSMPSIHFNGKKIISYPTLDKRVRMMVIVGDFEWTPRDREKKEVHFCSHCKSFMLPGETHPNCHPSCQEKEKL